MTYTFRNLSAIIPLSLSTELVMYSVLYELFVA